MFASLTLARRTPVLARSLQTAAVRSNAPKRAQEQAEAGSSGPYKYPYPYHIARTSRGGEPVYEDFVRGGRQRTLIRLIHGDSRKLLQDLRTTLFDPMGVTEQELDSRIRLPGHIDLRGHWRPQIVLWMRERGL
ncbi:hypothetical protein CALVIDRAFT_596059 [Calocera viscosa TUFC12733]|uniref:Large ribosomal subunit protein mL49 n=1 Tax=Calocera viscosa (strain TUFC12733) TaxID=1330018 RepID=A0A167Q6S1_CALVF|nr:hypothetical protein CALVIDRAFT_596059 [Calocera viscosa TUFC12733]